MASEAVQVGTRDKDTGVSWRNKAGMENVRKHGLGTETWSGGRYKYGDRVR